jgi:hypothetical protein
MKVSQYISLDDLPVLDPVEELSRCRSLKEHGAHIDTSKFWGKCNSWTYAHGFLPGRGYLLMPGTAVHTLRRSINSGSHVLEFASDSESLHFLDLTVVSCEAITGGHSFRGEAAYVVEVADKRVLGPLSFINYSFNVYSQAPSTAASADDQNAVWRFTQKASANWTYEQIVDAIWVGTGIPADDISPLQTIFSGSTLDKTKANFTGKTPFNYNFRGISAWAALQNVLEDIDHILVLDRDGNFHVQAAFGSNSDFTDAKNESSTYLLGHSQDVDGLAHKIPEKIKVFFPARNPAWWTADEPGVVTVNDFKHHTPYYEKLVETERDEAVAGTVLPIVDSLIANYDEEGTIQNQTACDDRATQIKTDYLARITNSSPSELIYSTARSFECGINVRALCYADFGDGVKTIVKTNYHNKPVSSLIKPFGAGFNDLDILRGQHSTFALNSNTSPILFPYGELAERFAVAKVATDVTIAANGKGNVKIQKGDRTSASVTTWTAGGGSHDTVEAWDITGRSYTDTDMVIIWLHPQVRRWLIIGSAAGTIIRGTLDGELTPGGSETITKEGGGTETVHDYLLQTGQSIAAGKKIIASLDEDGLYYVEAAACP